MPPSSPASLLLPQCSCTPVPPCSSTSVLRCFRAPGTPVLPVLPVPPVLLCSCTTVSRIGFPAHETTSAGTPVSRTSLSAHETTLAGTPVSIWSYPCARGRLVGQLFSGRALTLGGKMVTEPRSCSSCSTELKASARDREASLRCSIISSRFVQRARSAIANERIIARTDCSFPPHNVVDIDSIAFWMMSIDAIGSFQTLMSVLNFNWPSPSCSTSKILFIITYCLVV